MVRAVRERGLQRARRPDRRSDRDPVWLAPRPVQARSTQQAEIIRLAMPLQSTFSELLEGPKTSTTRRRRRGRASPKRHAPRPRHADRDGRRRPACRARSPAGPRALRFLRTATRSATSPSRSTSAPASRFPPHRVHARRNPPFEEARSQIRPRFRPRRNGRPRPPACARRSARACDLDAIAQAARHGQSVDGLALAAPAVPGFGREPRSSGLFSAWPGAPRPPRRGGGRLRRPHHGVPGRRPRG